MNWPALIDTIINVISILFLGFLGWLFVRREDPSGPNDETGQGDDR